MSTTIFIEFAPDSDRARAAHEATLGKAVGGVPTYKINGLVFNFSRAEGHWYWHSPERLLSVLDQLVELCRDPAGIIITGVKFEKHAGVVDHTAAFQGEYIGEGQFAGCYALVDNFMGKAGPCQSIVVSGPPAVYADFYRAIRTREIRPTHWLEEPPQASPA